MRLRTATDVAAVIRERQRALRMVQGTLAQRVGASRKWVVEVEKGKPRAALRLVLRTLEVLGLVLRVDSSGPARSTPTLPSAAVDLGEILAAHRRPRSEKR